MIAARTYANADVAVFGLARTGMGAVKALRAGGAKVYAWDDNEEQRRLAAAEGATILHWPEWPWDTLKSVVLSPGIPLTHPRPHAVVDQARYVGVEVIGDMEVFAREINGAAPVIAITGTNGKSTTTALIGHILKGCGFDAQIGGNIGKAVLELDPPNARTIYVLELSSYQIDLAPGLVPDVAVLSNITPDHLDRHGTLENYAAVKTRLLEQTSKTGQIAIGVDDALTKGIFTRHAGNGGPAAVPVSVGKVLGRGVFVVDGTLYDAQGQRAAKVMDLATAQTLPGPHNWQNAALAYAATRPYAKDARRVVEAIADFPGLAHRMEDVGRIGKVRFVNDSKATNADAAAKALGCYPDIFWIAGGKAKVGGIEGLASFFPRIRKAYLIGDAAAQFAATLAGKVDTEVTGTLAAAVRAAATDATLDAAPAPVVLLSPACASFDQFKDFEARGDAFRAAVAALKDQPIREAS
ncbi:MAG: UDP-N-acetylmuramoyl-L-alanine--D-glutamate ligase [Alphaproteobacteria bacterium]|nr:UDP-N-acetylmuramoyl-L-alanine--D-glutamate ligase [Alphaproteobacteria bacterium]MBL7097579.1 UDP-N-acetylmuramoyl-L-alanine--D-glutamate ligase [Alphaproteobacteria bacterium]